MFDPFLASRGRKRSLAAHHRRRRGLALVVVGLVALLGVRALALGRTGTGSSRPVIVAGMSGVRVGSAPRQRPARISATARERLREAEAIDRVMAAMPYVRVAGRQNREVALTFDDGPGPYTPSVLAILERYRVPATLFEIGVLERWFHDSTTRALADGFPIGDHTLAHAPMSELSPADQRAQLLGLNSVLAGYGVPLPQLFRPPYGLFNLTTLGLLHRYRMLMVLWTIDSQDYRRPGVRAIVRRVLSGLRPGAIILMHDAGGNRSQTVAALPDIIHAIHARGYRMVTVPRLLADNPPPLDQSVPAAGPGGG